MPNSEDSKNAELFKILQNSPRGLVSFFKKKRNAQELAQAVASLLNPIDPDEIQADPNAVNENKNTPLLIASCFKSKDYVEVVQVLLKQKSIQPDLTKDKNSHRTAFLINVENGNLENVKSFLDANLIDQNKVNVNAVDVLRKSALMLAAENGDLVMVKLLIERRVADINFMLTDKDGRTALNIINSGIAPTEIREEISKLIFEGSQRQIG